MTRNKIVAVTGLGIVSPLGCHVPFVWNQLLSGVAGTVSLRDRKHHIGSRQVGFEDLPCQVAAFVPRQGENSFDRSALFTKSEEKRWSPFIQYAMVAARQALDDAKWSPKSDRERCRTGVCIGSGIGSLDDIVTTAASYYGPALVESGEASESSKITNSRLHGFKKVSPYWIPRFLINMAAGHVSIEFGFKGPNHTVSTACTTGAHAIGDAMRFIQYGDADVMIAGGTEASISPLSIAGFAKARSLSTRFNDSPEKASRPFDAQRDGFIMGEGAGILVLESLDHALSRNAKIYALLEGYGLSSDAHHMTAPPENGDGAKRAMERALETSGRNVDDVVYVNAHATSTELGDIAEARAISNLVSSNERSEHIHVSSTKGATGHLLGAAGAIESIFTIMSIYTNTVPHTQNLEDIDPVISSLPGMNLVRMKPIQTSVDLAMTNSFGFGGTNASLLFSKFNPTT